MKVEVAIPAAGQGDTASAARRAEALGYDRLTATETAHNPFLALAIAAGATRRVDLATSIAIAFARSPMVTAQLAWDLRELSGGRFQLGLGTQVKGHVIRRYSSAWSAPGPRMREYLNALRAIWASWEAGGTRLQFSGESYQFSLMTPEYSPGKSEHPPIPVTVAGAGPYMARIAGESCDGLRLPAFASVKYAREMLLPEVARGAERGGRTLHDIDICAQPWLAIGTSQDAARQRERFRRLVALHGGDRSHKAVWEVHGWGEVAGRLQALGLEARYDEMTRLVSDEMVDTFVVQGTPDEVVAQLKQGWGAVATTLAFGFPGDDPALAAAITALRA